MSRQLGWGKLHRLILAAFLLALAACGLAGMLAGDTQSTVARIAALDQARARWQERGVAHYRLVFQAPTWCRTDAEIKYERIVQIYENSCPGGARTVTDLFELVQALDRNPEARYCSAGGCECVERRIAHIDYDPTYGFPRAIRMRRLRETNWNGFWEHVVRYGLPNCLTPRDTNVVIVLKLEPIS